MKNLRFTNYDSSPKNPEGRALQVPYFSRKKLETCETRLSDFRGLANRQSQIVNSKSAFTILEIAISIGVVAFALVAILGVLPTGVRSQQEMHEETVINQDGPYFLEMIRNGARGLDHLTNFVEWVQIVSINGSSVTTNIYTNSAFPLSIIPPGNRIGQLSSGEVILLALSTPRFVGNSTVVVTNTVSAYVHSLSGAAVEKGRASPELGFAYLLSTEIMPFDFFAYSTTNFFLEKDDAGNDVAPALTNSTPENVEHYQRFLQSRQMSRAFFDPTNANFFELRLTCRWPLRPDMTTGRQRQTYRTMVSSTMTNMAIVGVPLIFPGNDDGGSWLPGFSFVPHHFAEIHNAAF